MTSDAKAASVRQRLLTLAQSRGDDYNQILIRYVGLRFLARLAASKHADKFVLKGATMFLVWHGSLHRPTRDIDLLRFVDADEATLAELIQSVCTHQVDEDGVRFDPKTVRVERIREETAYGGLRCQFDALLGSAKLRVQLDVGFGDDVTPEPKVVEIPRLLDDEAPRQLKAYTPETVVAEKLEAIVRLGLANSRMKDYFDIDVLLRSGEIDRQNLAEALRRTFTRRKTPLPKTLPTGLTEEFWSDESAQRRWRAFQTKNGLKPVSLEDVCHRIGQEFLAAVRMHS